MEVHERCDGMSVKENKDICFGRTLPGITQDRDMSWRREIPRDALGPVENANRTAFDSGRSQYRRRYLGGSENRRVPTRPRAIAK